MVSKFVYTQGEFIRSATNFYADSAQKLVRNTVIPANLCNYVSGQLDGVAECVDLKNAVSIDCWLLQKWEEYHE